jgi:hypothetical protein
MKLHAASCNATDSNIAGTLQQERLIEQERDRMSIWFLISGSSSGRF